LQRQGDDRGRRGERNRSPAELGEERNRKAAEEESSTEDAGEAATGDDARQSEPEALSARGPAGARGTARPHINSATRNELLANADIDESLADRILAERPFRTVEDMDDVLDIGRERIARIGQSMTLPREMGEGRDR
jgi:DNA uptake protein ComE-like DNA-binding protein